MSIFSSTALDPGSPLFQGRQAELKRLIQLCQDKAYIVLYSAPCNGKAGLLKRLASALQPTVRVCHVDFRLIQGASPERAFAFLAKQIASALPLAPDASQVTDGLALRDLLVRPLAELESTRLVVLLDEFSVLPAPTREALANVLSSFFDDRHDIPDLAKLQIVFSGGVELYDLLNIEAPSLDAICEKVYLADLEKAEAVALIADGLQGLRIHADTSADSIGNAVYACAAGHPYFTPKIGSILEMYHDRGDTLTPNLVGVAARQIQRDDPVLQRILNVLREQRLEEAARRLLSDPPPYKYTDVAMARLELIGLAKPAG
jgi:hypothetical protein